MDIPKKRTESAQKRRKVSSGAFTESDHKMAEAMFQDSQSISRFYCTFNDSASGNNPQEAV